MAVGISVLVPVTPTPAVVALPMPAAPVTPPRPRSVADDLVKVRDYLHDATGTLWTQDELLRLYNDGYRRLLVRSSAVRDHQCFDVPPRNSFTLTFDWEDSVVTGQVWMCMLMGGDTHIRCTTRWEAQALGHGADQSIPLTGAGIGITQQWERFISGGDVDRNYDVVLPRNERMPNRVRFNNTIMLPISTIELDQVHIQWPSFVGQPYWWTSGFGRVKTLEIYRIQTDYTDAYILLYQAGLEDRGMPRNWSGVRSYTQDLTSVFAQNRLAYTTPGDAQYLTTVTGAAVRITELMTDLLTNGYDTSLGPLACYRWETVLGYGNPFAFCVGMPREISSPDRQYFPVQRGSGINLSVGTIRDWQSSD